MINCSKNNENKMKHSFLVFFLLPLFLLISCHENVDSVVKKNLDIRGGKENLKKLKSIEIKMQLNAVGMQVPLHIYLQKPMKMRTEMQIGNQSVTTILNENRGWANVDGKITELKDEALEDLKNNFHSQIRYFTSELFDYQSLGGKINSMSKEKFKGKNSFKIQIDYNDGQRSYVFLDAKTYLNLGTRTEKKVEGNLLQTETVYSDYRKINNLFIPFKMEIFSDKMNVLTLQINSIQFDKSFPPSTFSVD